MNKNTNLGNIITFLQYILLNESELEDLYVSDNPIDNIELVHEMEWKLRQIIEHKYRFNPKMYVNIIKRFSKFALESYEDLSPKFEHLFQYWLDHHSIDNPYNWAKNVYNENEENLDTPQATAAHWSAFSVSKSQIIQMLSSEEITELLQYNFGGDLISHFENIIPEFLTSKEVPMPLDSEDVADYDDSDYWESHEAEAVDYVIDNDLEDEFHIYIAELIKDIGDADIMVLDRDTWIKGIAEIMHPQYYEVHGYSIESVTEDIEEQLDRFHKSDESARNAEDIISNLHPDDVDLDANIETVMDIVGNITVSISLAMNVMHTSGNIVTDYGREAGLEDLDVEYLANFNKRDVDDWRDELQKLIK